MQVYKAQLDGVDEVAIKLLKPETAADDSSARQFLAEIDVLRACRNQHVVTFLGAWAQKVCVPAWACAGRKMPGITFRACSPATPGKCCVC